MRSSAALAEEARTLLDSIPGDTVVGMRDRALMALMVYKFARVGAVIKMRSEDVYVQGRRTWVRLHEKGGKLEIAQRMANHESARTTGLYDRRDDQVSLDQVERILI